ncbi:MAG TPA: CYTH domain-containing protein [Reyranella sp.]|jgi:CYTH domain-containing protein|nr:CYTH domain-containing protein [Reyranella sp.]
MPIENERKFVLLDDGRLEQQLAHVPGVTKSFLRQAYLDVSGMRIRSLEADGRKRYVFTYKREVDGQVVEIETDINVQDFDRLWSQRRETLQKARYSWNDDRFHWDVDFFKTAEGRTYFAQAEVEMPEDDKAPPPLPPRLVGHLLAMAPAGDQRFTSKRLADPAHAERLLADIRKKGKIE